MGDPSKEILIIFDLQYICKYNTALNFFLNKTESRIHPDSIEELKVTKDYRIVPKLAKYIQTNSDLDFWIYHQLDYKVINKNKFYKEILSKLARN